MKYAVIVEEGESSFGAHVPDLPSCVAVGDTKAEVLKLIQEAIQFHIEGLREDGQPVPAPSSSVEYVESARLKHNSLATRAPLKRGPLKSEMLT